MIKTFDMQFIRYINLFGKVTKIRAKHCFAYNNTLVFVVDKEDINRAIGRDNVNLKQLSSILGKRIRVVAQPRGMGDLKNFVSVLVSPAKFENIEVIENIGVKEAIITTNERESKAMMIGRGRVRQEELKKVLEEHFGIRELKIL